MNRSDSGRLSREKTLNLNGFHPVVSSRDVLSLETAVFLTGFSDEAFSGTNAITNTSAYENIIPNQQRTELRNKLF